MAVVLGNIALILDPTHATSPRYCTLPDRKSLRPAVPILSDAVLNLFKKESFGLEFDGEVRKEKSFVKKEKLKSKSKVNAVDYENSSDDENGNGNGNGFGDEDEDGFNWEEEMRRRVKEIEEMRELEKKAEEVQNRVDEEFNEDGGENKEETEEEKRMRVRKELEKVTPFGPLFLLLILIS